MADSCLWLILSFFLRPSVVLDSLVFGNCTGAAVGWFADWVTPRESDSPRHPFEFEYYFVSKQRIVYTI